MIWSISDLPGNNGFMVNNSANIQPTDQRSMGVEYSLKTKPQRPKLMLFDILLIKKWTTIKQKVKYFEIHVCIRVHFSTRYICVSWSTRENPKLCATLADALFSWPHLSYEISIVANSVLEVDVTSACTSIMYSNNKEERDKSLWSRVLKQSLFYATFLYLTLTSDHKNYIIL